MYALKEDLLLVIVEGKRYQVKITKRNGDLITNCIKKCQELDEYDPTDGGYTQVLDDIKNMVNPANKIECKTDGRFIFDGEDQLFLKGAEYEPIPDLLAQRILDFLDNGINVNALVNFWKNCLLNEDQEAIKGLFRFLEHNGHPITINGYFFGYKKVQISKRYDKKTGDVVQAWEFDEDTGEKKYVISDQTVFQDMHSGTFKQKIGDVKTMPRKDCNSDPNVMCSTGLHIASWDYAGGDLFQEGGFGGSDIDKAIVTVIVNPRHVVAVPHDYNGTKMRCCEYYLAGLSNSELQDIYSDNKYLSTEQKEMEADIAKRIDIKDEEKARLRFLMNRS